jgi:hypothetical protein
MVGNARECWAHDPALAEKRAAMRRKGGQNKATAKRLDRLVPASLKPTIATLFTALEEVHAGDLEPKQGQAMAALAGAIARLYSVGVLEERIAALEAALPRDAGRMSG